MKFVLENVETARLQFRKINNADFDQWLGFFKDPSSFEHWTGEFDKPEIECKKWFKRQAERYENDEGGMNALIEKNEGNLIGYAGLLVQVVDGLPELEVAYSLLPDFRNKGLASEAAIKCRDYAFENDFADSLISIVSLSNAPSANVAVKNGMHIEKQTVYKENQVNIFRIFKTDWQKNQNAIGFG
jgi:ribosomal-protein-alanine N-acetyltransferase